jgi:hypothetical protein
MSGAWWTTTTVISTATEMTKAEATRLLLVMGPLEYGVEEVLQDAWASTEDWAFVAKVAKKAGLVTLLIENAPRLFCTCVPEGTNRSLYPALPRWCHFHMLSTVREVADRLRGAVFVRD